MGLLISDFLQAAAAAVAACSSLATVPAAQPQQRRLYRAGPICLVYCGYVSS
uniref:Uncharacterized protein n=1 Tax=Arundo donax TaxID=35708 RepID=A0A0A9DBJ2_ARUDO